MSDCCGWLCCALNLLLVYVVYRVLDFLYRTPTVGDFSSRYILVTGCDSGFGQQIARRLDANGCHVFAGCLTEAGETELRKTCSSRLHTISLDVSRQDSVRNAFQSVVSKLPPGTGLWGVLNNAGILGRIGQCEWLSIDDYNKVLAVNLLGLIDVTMTFLPLVKKSRGRIVNTASIVGRYAISDCGPYCISKYGVEAFTDGLRRSLRAYKVQAVLIEPGFHRTPITSGQNVNSMFEQAWNGASTEIRQEFGEEFFRQAFSRVAQSFDIVNSPRVSDVIDAYEHALLSRFPRVRYVVGSDARFLWLPLQALPEWLGDWLIEQLDRGKPIPAVLQK